MEPSAPSLAAFLQVFIPLLLVLILPHFREHFGLKIMTSSSSSATGPLSSSSYRPRSSLTRALITKLEHEQIAREQSESAWYTVDLQSISDDRIRNKFQQLSADEETKAFLEQSFDKSDWIFTQIYHNVAKAFLSLVYSQTDINGILGRGAMFVLSREHYSVLTNGFTGENLIDLGAGDGAPTLVMAPSYKNVYATETSGPMRRLLKSKDIQVLEVESWHESGPFDAISCLNLLDRADNPLTILRTIKDSLKPQGLVIVGLVLPFKPFVEANPPGHRPSQLLEISGQNKGQQLETAVQVIEAVGLELTAWSRVPYLCEGDLNRPIYHLDDYVMIFKHK